MRAALAALAILGSTTAAAASVDGMGRISAGGGWRLTPNEPFFNKAAEVGAPVSKRSGGGPQGTASFGYGASDLFEVCIDLFIGGEGFTLGADDFSALTYGALLGGRLTKADFPFAGLTPWLGIGLGPTLAFITSKTRTNPERLITSYAVDVGAMYRVSDRFGVQLGVRYLFAYAEVDGIGSANAGGLFFTLGLSILFPKTAGDMPTTTF